MLQEPQTRTLWRFLDGTGTERIGIFERAVDLGGTDVTYYMRDANGRTHLLSGSRLKNAKTFVGVWSPQA